MPFEGKPDVSVIINCYNGAGFIEQAIESVLRQTFVRFELIIWDNCSTDDTLNIVKRFKDKRIRCFSAKKHTSLYKARNLAFSKSVGSFICFLDVDDYWLPTKIERQIDLFSNSNVGVVYGNFYLLKEKQLCIAYYKPRRLPRGFIATKICYRYPIGFLTVMFKRNFWVEGEELFDTRFNVIGDYAFLMSAAQRMEFAVCDEPLAVYRIHDKSFSSMNKPLELKELSLWFEELWASSLSFSSLQRLKIFFRIAGLAVKTWFNQGTDFNFRNMVVFLIGLALVTLQFRRLGS